MQSICNNYTSSELMQLIFEQVPVPDLFDNRTVFKSWNHAVNMNEVNCIIELIHISAIQTFRSQNKQRGSIYISFIKDPLNQKAFVPFNIYDHISFLEKVKHVYNWCGACFLIFKTIITIHLSEAMGLISEEYAMEARKEVHAQVRKKILEVYKNFKVNQILVHYDSDKNLNQHIIKKFVFSPLNIEHKTYVKDSTIQALEDFFKEHFLFFPVDNMNQ